jgi:glycosyltransferase involved in cell wall biosynthesis
MISTMKRNLISAVIITKNEAKNIQKCMESLSFCDEIVIVDSQSTDQTKELALTFQNVKWVDQPFLGYGKQKQMAVAHATHDWILSIDADEWATPELIQEMQDLKNHLHQQTTQIWSIPRTLIFLGAPLHYCGEYARPVTRFFHKAAANFNDALVHESVVATTSSTHQLTYGNLKHQLMHRSYTSLEDYLARSNKYTTEMAIKLDQTHPHPGAPSVLTILGRFGFTFFKIYILYAGFLDGMRGLIWSLSSAFANAIKYAKYYELLITKNHKN